MKTAALVAWTATAMGGVLMVAIWVAKGAFRPNTDGTSEAAVSPNVDGTRTRIPLDLLVPHASLALTGLILFLLFLANADHSEYSSFTWIALGGLGVVIPLGLVMVRIWRQDRHSADGVQLAEQSFPTALVAFHGLGAAVTFALVLGVALSRS